MAAHARCTVVRGLSVLEQRMQYDASETAAAGDMQCAAAQQAEDGSVAGLSAAFDHVRGACAEPGKATSCGAAPHAYAIARRPHT